VTTTAAHSPTNLEWMDDGLCRQVDADMFHPEVGGPTKDARRVCMACDVRVQCLDYALTTPGCLGIWGGTSEGQRRAMKRERVAA
jgi:WhiB family redox-sensing transcriptional regulator